MVWDSRLIDDPLNPEKRIFLFEQIKRDALQLVKSIPESQPATIHFFPFDRRIHDEKTFQLLPAGKRDESIAEIQDYLTSLEATGKETYIFSAIQKIIPRFRNQANQPGLSIATTIFALTDGVDTEPNYPDNLRIALEMFQDWADNSIEKPWLYTLHILPDNLAERDKQKLALEKEAFAEVRQAKMVTSAIGHETSLRIIRPRIPELDFGYWLPNEQMPERQLSFDYITNGTGTEAETIALTFTPVFEREQSELPVGMDVVFPHAETNTIARGSGSYVAKVRLAPTLVNPIPDADFLLAGTMEISADARIIIQPETIRWRMHLGRPPTVALHPIQPATGSEEILVSGALPEQISRFYRIQRIGRVSGAIESVNVSLVAEVSGITFDKPVILLADRAGFDTGSWTVSDWDTAEYARVTIPLPPDLQAGRYSGKIILHASGASGFRLQGPGGAGPTDQLQLPFDLGVVAAPEPLWRVAVKGGAGLILLLATVGGIYWLRRPAFQDVELQVVAADTPEAFDSNRIVDSLYLRGRGKIAIGQGCGRLEVIEAKLIFIPEHRDSHDELRVRLNRRESRIKHFRRDDTVSSWMEMENAGDDFLVYDGDVLACGDLAIRISSVSYNEANLEPDYEP
ncbi:MAG: hypothetical protein L3J03_08230 [Desulfobacterales bacterium]|nr:hypothetical protein [Desulfobacterales bacterium]